MPGYTISPISISTGVYIIFSSYFWISQIYCIKSAEIAIAPKVIPSINGTIGFPPFFAVVVLLISPELPWPYYILAKGLTSSFSHQSESPLSDRSPFGNIYFSSFFDRFVFFCFSVSETYDTTLILAKSVQIEKIRHSLRGFRHSFIEKGWQIVYLVREEQKSKLWMIPGANRI